jgi:hypothetical protein
LTRDSFSVVWADGRVYLLINDGGTLKRVSMSGEKKDRSGVEIASGVSNVIFPKVTNYNTNSTVSSLPKSFSGVMEYVYYTTARENHNDNKMYRWHIASGSGNGAPIASNDGIEDGKTYTPKYAADGRFIFTAKGAGTNDMTELYMSSKPTDNYANLNTVQTDSNSLVVGNVDSGFPKFDSLKFYLPTEKTAGSSNATANLLVVYNSRLYLCGVTDNKIIFGKSLGSATNTVDEVVLATAAYIYVNGSSNINILSYTGKIESGVINVSGQNSMPLSVIQPCDKDGHLPYSGVSSLIFMMTDSGIFLIDKSGKQHEIAINVKNNRPTEEETTTEESTDDGTYSEEYSL